MKTWIIALLMFFIAPAQAAQVAWYPLDEQGWNGTPGEIIDASGNGHDGVAVGNAINIAAGRVCRGGRIPANSTDGAQDAIDTGVDLDSTVGGTGTISFWFQTTVNWAGSGDRMLVDASTTADNKYFFLIIRNNGRLRFRLEDSADADFQLESSARSFNAGEWHHLAISWDLPNGRMQVFIDGVLDQGRNINSTSALGELGSVYFGDNRSSYHPSGTARSANGVFDELRIHDRVQSVAEITADMNATHPCIVPPIVEYRFDECAYSGTAGEVVDSQGSYPATAFYGVTTQRPGQIQGYLDESDRRHQVRTVNTIPMNTTWTVSTWFRMPFVTTQRYHVLGAMEGGGDLMYLDRNQNYRWGVYFPGKQVNGSFRFGTLADGWHFLTLVGNNQGADGQTLLYIDGNLQDQVNLQSRGNLRYIGTSYDNANSTAAQGFGTALDEFLVFDQALDAADVSAIHALQLNGLNVDGTLRPTVICPGMLPCAAEFRDEFSAVSFSNNDGDMNFSGPWDEFEGSSPTVPEASPDPTTGHVRISGGRLLLNNYSPESQNFPGVERELDLTGFTSASLDFDFQTSGGVDTVDSFVVRASANGGASWTVLEDIRGINDTSGSKSYDLTPFISAQTRISLRFNNEVQSGLGGGCCYGGSGETFAIDNVSIKASRSCAVLDHFNINVGAGNASTCAPFAFSITAEDSSNNPLPDYSGSVDITTSTAHGNLATVSATHVLSPNPDNDDNGSASYLFDSADNGQIDLSLDNQRAESLTITVTDSSIPVASTSASIRFSDNAFVIEDVDTAIAGDNVPVAGRNHDYRIRLMRKDPTTGVCAVATGYSGNRNLKLWRVKNVADPSTTAPGISGTPLPSAEPATANATIAFTAGEASVQLSSSDIGKYTLEALDSTRSFADIDIAGGSAEQTLRPFGIGIDFSNLRDADFADNAVIDDSTGSDLSYAAGIAGSVFTQAGEDFSITVGGALWQAGDDSDDNGIPDVGSYLGDNPAAPSFGAEGEMVQLTPSVVEPAGASLATLVVDGSVGGLFNNFSNGEQTAAASYGNVGIIDLAAALTDNDYFGSGVAISGQAIRVGRFNPWQYAVVSSSVTPFCSSAAPFTYARQAFNSNLTLQAQNKSGNRTDGYRDAFVTLNIPSELNLLNDQTGLAYDLESYSLGESFGSGTPGQADLSVELAWNMPLQAPTVSTVQLVDTTDEVTRVAGSPYAVGQTEIRFGRMNLRNSHGSELLDLPLPMQAEYYDGSNFLLNVDDGCSVFATSQLVLDSAVESNQTDGDIQVLAGQVSQLSLVHSPLLAGDAGLSLCPPGNPACTPTSGNEGWVDLRLDLGLHPWLRFDWSGNGLYDNDPTARATFGIFRGNSRQIYMRQLFD